MNQIIDIINLITIETAPGRNHRICDDICDTIFAEKEFKATRLLLVSSITEAVSLLGPAYSVDVLTQEFLSHLGIADSEVLRHKKITLHKVDVLSQKVVFTHQSYITSIAIKGNELSFTVASAFSSLGHDLAESYSPLCRAEFCDQRCGLNTATFTRSAKIISVPALDKVQLDVAANNYDELHIYGFLPLTIHGAEGSVVTVDNPYHYKLEAGLDVQLVVTCDKRANTCITRFNNIINFRGEPYVNDTINIVL